MNRAFLIARQEFIKYITRRGFAISIVMFPLWIAIVTLVPQWTGGSDAPQHHRLTVVDRTGGTYAQFFTDVLARKPASDLVYVPAPAYLVRPDAKHFAPVVRDALDGRIHTAAPDFDTVIVIPEGFGAGRRNTAEIWRRGARDADLRDFVTGTLADALRFKTVQRLAPRLHDPALLDVAVDLQYRSPDRGPAAGSSMDSAIPIALAIILFVVSVMNSSALLQGVVEEKSTRMIEVLLSCATAREITTGKLIGVIAVALTTLLIWALALFVLMAIASHDTVALVFASLRATASLETLPFLLVFFLCGLLIYGSLFLAIGSMANSLADAQALLGPSMLILMLPNLMIAGVMRDPNGTLASTLSWVPVYTPFFMMLRIASHPPAWQLWGTLALAIATTALLIWWTGRVFAKHVLTTERPPSLGALIGRLIPGRRLSR